MMGLLGLRFTGFESDFRRKMNDFKQWIAPPVINGAEIGQELQDSSRLMEEEPAKDSSGRPRVETTPGSQVSMLHDMKWLQIDMISMKENAVARFLLPKVVFDSGLRILTYERKNYPADSDFLRNEFDSELSLAIFPHSPIHSDGAFESLIDSDSCDAARVMAREDGVDDGSLSGGGGGQLVDGMEESSGKQYFSDISHFCLGLAMKRVLSESAFSISYHHLNYHFSPLCVI